MKPNFELDLNFKPAWRSKFKCFEAEFRAEFRYSKCFEDQFRAEFQFRATLKIGIQNILKPNIKLDLHFQSSSKIDIKNVLNPNCELDMNLEPAGICSICLEANFELVLNFEQAWRSKNILFWSRISSWVWISSLLEYRYSKYFNEYRAGFDFRASSKINVKYDLKPNIELDSNFEPVRRSKFKLLWSWISRQLEDRNSNCFETEFKPLLSILLFYHNRSNYLLTAYLISDLWFYTLTHWN